MEKFTDGERMAPPPQTRILSRRESDDIPVIRRMMSGESQGGINTHFFLKWPTYLFIAIMTFLLLIGYVIVRGAIQLIERVMETSSTKRLRHKMLSASNYREWQAIARKLDKLSGFDGWKQAKRSRFYNNMTIEKYLKDIQSARSDDDPTRMCRILRDCLNDPLTSGVLKEELYSQCWDGTKAIVEEYVQTVVMGLCYLASQVASGSVDTDLVRHLLETSSYGKTALCLSGGGSLGQQHFGVLKALLEGEALPNIISGTSAGAVVGAFICTRTDEEFKKDFNAEYIKSISTALDCPWPKRIWRYMTRGELFSFPDWVDKIPPWTMGDLTFIEAYRKTNRVLNVSTTANNFSVNLNYITSPNVLIRSAVLCSSAMPVFVKPPQLLEKCPDGSILTRDAQNFSDGSLAGDVPRGELGSLFGVRFVLTSQVNPHISPFFFNRKGEAGNPLVWRWGKTGAFRGGFILSALESFFKEQMRTLLKVMRDVEIDPAFHGLALPQAFLQNFAGDITITSQRSLIWKMIHCLDGPRDADEINWWVKEGELMMWPKMSVVISRMRIEQAIDDLAKALNGH
jgi:predicted acylesterase/phospholipase RssA